MADYKELLRRAISALPENNGAARRAVYEKARSALVGQLRAITPPLPARDITQHRLQLEDCIRQVEQEASEAVITLGRESVLGPRATAAPADPMSVQDAAQRPTATEKPTPAPAQEPIAESKPVEAAPPMEAEVAETTPPAKPTTSIEDIISEAAETSGAPVKLVKDEEPVPGKPELRTIPSIVARAEASKTGPTSPLPSSSNVRPMETPLKGATFEPRRDALPLAANSTGEVLRSGGRIEPSVGNRAVARQMAPAVAETLPVEQALSSVREVEVEPDASEAQVAIERAIETLDHEARGESGPAMADTAARPAHDSDADARDDSGFAEAEFAR